MKIRSFSKKTKKFGYSYELEYNNLSFHGHQIGVAVCVKDDKTGVIESNYLSESLGDEKTRDFLLSELFEDEDIILVTKHIMQADNGYLAPKTVYYMPYYVVDHTRFKPTVMHDNVDDDCNTTHRAKVELLLVVEGLSRYITVPVYTRNVSIMDVIYEMFEDDDNLEDIHIKYQEDDGESFYVLDFYDVVGERHDLTFSNGEQIRNAIVSMRLIEIERQVDGEKEDEKA